MRSEPASIALLVIAGDFPLPDAPAQVRIQEALDVAIQDALEIADVVAGSHILHPLIGMQEIIANLRSKTGLGFFLIFGRLLRFAFFFLESGETGAEHLDRRRAILVLATLVLALYDDVLRNVR